MNKNRFANYNSRADKPQHSVYQTHILTRLEHWAVLCTLRQREIQEKNRTLSRGWCSETKPSTQTQATLLTRWQQAPGDCGSYPFHSISMLSPTAREYPFPSGQPRGKEAGNVSVFGSYTLSMCVCILVINGGLSNICSFFFAATWHAASLSWLQYDTNSGHQVFLAALLNVVTQWLPSFRHGQKSRLLYS